MDFHFTLEEENFRQEVQQFISTEPPEDFPTQGDDEGYGCGAWSFEYLRRLGEKGWISRCWPIDCGGQGKPITELFILLEELSYHWAPFEALFYTEAVTASIIRFGSSELKESILPQAASGTVTFWEGFSEPGAGSDLLALTTKATKEGDNYIISGQKTWNSNAHKAHYGFTAARTDPNVARHKGISMFLIDMASSGISTRPIEAMYGGIPFAEVFFDDVKVSNKQLVGQENNGFQQILESLEWDRFWGRCVKAASHQRMLEEIVKYANESKRDGIYIAADPYIRHELAQLAIEVEICRMLFYDPLHKLNIGEPLNFEAALAKTFADEMGQRLANTCINILGLRGQLRDDLKWAPLKGRLQRWYLCSPLYTLAGGTSEIQRNTIATRGLGFSRS